MTGRPSCARGRVHIGARREADIARRRQAERQPDLLGADLVHAQRRAEHVGTGVGHAERFQQALQHAVFAAALVAVQDVEHAVDLSAAPATRPAPGCRPPRCASTPRACSASSTLAPEFSDTSRSELAAAHQHGDAAELRRRRAIVCS